MIQKISMLFLLFSTLNSFAQVTISAFTPEHGAMGTSITITGTNFSSTAANNTVRVGGAIATVTSASTTQLTVTTSTTSASNGLITVSNSSGIATSHVDFSTTFSGGIAATASAGTQFVLPKTTISGNTINGFSYDIGSYLSSCDLDNDGSMDIIDIASTASSSLRVFRNISSSGQPLSSSSFDTAVTFTLAANSISVYNGSVDFNNDGKLDILVGRSDGFSILQNTTSGSTLSFTRIDFNISSSSTNRFAVADFDKDGDLDLVGRDGRSSTLRWFQNTYSGSGTTISFGGVSSGTLSAAYTISMNKYVSDLVAGDFDNDGDMDIATMSFWSGNQRVELVENTNTTSGTLSFSSTVHTLVSNLYQTSYWDKPMAIAAGDIDNDGDLDIVAATHGVGTSYASKISLLRNDGSLSFTHMYVGADQSSTSQLTCNVQLKDINGDSKLDIVYYDMNSGQNIFAIMNNYSSGTFAASDFATKSTLKSNPGNGFGLVVEDLNNDGRCDVMITTYSSGILSLMTNGKNVYYSKSTGDLNLTSSWGDQANGTGTSPVSLTTDGSTYILANRATYSLSANTSIGALSLENGKLLDLGTYNLSVNAIYGANATTYINTSSTGKLVSNIPNNNTFFFPVGISAYNPVSITNKSGTSDSFYVVLSDAVLGGGTTGSAATSSTPHVGRTWDINKNTANAGSGVDFTFYWNSGEEVGTIVTPKLYHHDGSSWVKQTGTTSTNATSLSYTGYTGTFSPFTIGDNGTALPVELMNFDVQLNDGIAQLSWTTANELNNSHFEIQRSFDGVKFEMVGTKAGQGTSQTLSTYSYLDRLTNTNIEKVFYRLKQVDFDGMYDYSDVRVLFMNKSTSGRNLVGFPNPTSNEFNVILGLQDGTNYKVNVINAFGVSVFQNNEVYDSNKLLKINAIDWKSGVYLITIEAEGQVSTLQFRKL